MPFEVVPGILVRMGSFFKNLLKSNSHLPENETKKPSGKWFSIFKKSVNEQVEETIENGVDCNQRKLKNSKQPSFSNSRSTSEFNLNSENLLLLPKLKRSNFHVPELVSSTEWLRSQTFEVSHILYSFSDLIQTRNAKLSRMIDCELDEIIPMIDDKNTELKEAVCKLIELVLKISKAEGLLWQELKLEAHINSLLVQLLELATQLPNDEFDEIISSLHSKDEDINLSIYLVK